LAWGSLAASSLVWLLIWLHFSEAAKDYIGPGKLEAARAAGVWAGWVWGKHRWLLGGVVALTAATGVLLAIRGVIAERRLRRWRQLRRRRARERRARR
jgi:hypothetical protein